MTVKNVGKIIFSEHGSQEKWNPSNVFVLQCLWYASFIKWLAGLKSYESCCTAQTEVCRHDKKKSTAPLLTRKQAVAPNVWWTVETSTGQYCWYKIIFIKIYTFMLLLQSSLEKTFYCKGLLKYKVQILWLYSANTHCMQTSAKLGRNFAKGQILLRYILKASYFKVEIDNGRGFRSHKTNIF